MRIVVVGATGHVGGYLVPRLVNSGHDVVAVSRGHTTPYRADPAWEHVENVTVDRQAEDVAGTFGPRVAGMGADVVIDLICFTEASARQLVEAMRPTGALLVHCGSIWVHGPSVAVPTREDAPRQPFGDYGVNKAAIEAYLHQEHVETGFRSIVLHPGHISGPGWPVINPAGNLDLTVWEALAHGGQVVLPHLGLETVHHVHADDVAQAFERAIDAPTPALGASFHAVSERAVSLRGFAQEVASWFGQEANLRFVPFDEFEAAVGAENAAITMDHISRSPSASLENARAVVGYSPRYTSFQAVAEALRWLEARHRVDLGAGFVHGPGPGAIVV